MAASSFSLMACRILFIGLGCFMLATLVYTIATDGSPFRNELLTPWMIATLIDFYANVVAISVWVIYKETSWVNAAIWVILLICVGSVATCAYIVLKLLDISSQDLHDLVSRILLRSDYNLKMKGSYVVFLRILFTALGIFVLAVVTYTTITDGLPFRKELLTPWMAATLIDFYINVTAISVWVVHKESTWVGALFWILLLICFGSITTSAYIVIQLCRLSSQEPMYRALLGSQSKHENSSPSK